MTAEPVWERADVQAILTGVFHIRGHLVEIVELLGGDDGKEEEDEGSEGT